MALVTTVGGKTANSYASVAEFKTYRTNRLPAVAAVLAAVDADIEIALIVAARALDNCFTWTGGAADPASDDATAHQALTWPRNGMYTRNGFSIPNTVNPDDLKEAQCEWAYQMLAGADFAGDNDAFKKGVKAVRAGSVAVEFQSVDVLTKESADIIIRKMQSELNWASDAVPGEVRRLLVPSWFKQPSIKRPVLFKAVG